MYLFLTLSTLNFAITLRGNIPTLSWLYSAGNQNQGGQSTFLFLLLLIDFSEETQTLSGTAWALVWLQSLYLWPLYSTAMCKLPTGISRTFHIHHWFGDRQGAYCFQLAQGKAISESVSARKCQSQMQSADPLSPRTVLETIRPDSSWWVEYHRTRRVCPIIYLSCEPHSSLSAWHLNLLSSVLQLFPTKFPARLISAPALQQEREFNPTLMGAGSTMNPQNDLPSTCLDYMVVSCVTGPVDKDPDSRRSFCLLQDFWNVL